MKAVISIILTLALALGGLIANAQDVNEKADGFHSQEMDGKNVNDMHAGKGYIGPELMLLSMETAIEDDKDHTSFSEVMLPSPINLPSIKKEIQYAHAQECIGLSGTYKYEVFVDACGNYVKHRPLGNKDLTGLTHYFRELSFSPARMGDEPVAAWVEVRLNYGSNH